MTKYLFVQKDGQRDKTEMIGGRNIQIFRTKKNNLNQNHVVLIQVHYFFFLKNKKGEWMKNSLDFSAWHWKF